MPLLHFSNNFVGMHGICLILRQFFVKVQLGFYCPIDWVTCEWVALKLDHSNCKGQKSLFLEVFFVFLVQFAGLFIGGHSKQQVRANYFFLETSSNPQSVNL